jgi:hypothetical protein
MFSFITTTKKELKNMMTRIFGKALKGNAIHYAAQITPEGYGKAACDYKTPIKINPNATIAEVTCAKCRRYKDYRDWAKQAEAESGMLSDPPHPPESPTKNGPEEASAPQQAVPKAKPKTQAKPKQKPARKTSSTKAPKEAKPKGKAPVLSATGAETASATQQDPEIQTPDAAPTKPKANGVKAPQPTKPAPPPVDDPEGPIEKVDNRPLKEEDYKTFLESKKTESHHREEALKRASEIGHYESKFRKGNCLISHVPSRKHMFTIPKCTDPAIAQKVIESLNALSLKWDGQGALPRDFIPAAVTAFKAACEANGIQIKLTAKTTTPETKPTKPARKIKRRETKSTRKIRRRTEEPKAKSEKKNKYGFRPNSIRAEIAHCLEKGIPSPLLKIHIHTRGFKLTDKQINAKVKGTIRNLLKKGYEFQQVISKDETRCSIFICSTPSDKMPL